MNRKFPWSSLSFEIHPTFWLVIIISVWTGYFYEILTLFAVVTIHEMGHVTAAWSLGWRVRSITLLPFGGVASMDEWGTAPAREEIIVALAGPFYHVYIVLFSLGAWKMNWWTDSWTEYFVLANLSIALFNLLPIYPLDGGRIVQAFLSKFMPYQRSLLLTIYMSLFLTSILIVFSFTVLNGIGFFPLLVIGIFLLYSNWKALQEQSFPLWRMLFQRYNQGAPHTLPHQTIKLHEKEPWTKLLLQWRKDHYHLIHVYRGNRLIAIYPEEEILKRLFQLRQKSA